VDPSAVSGAVEQREELERLERALAELPLESRELVVLRFIEEMSYAEIATTTGRTEAALRGKVFRALKLLRDHLAGPDGGGVQIPGRRNREREARKKGTDPIRREDSHAM
jgi:RNA polymerase sigma-70 factor (ECF subfamily)